MDINIFKLIQPSLFLINYFTFTAQSCDLPNSWHGTWVYPYQQGQYQQYSFNQTGYNISKLRSDGSTLLGSYSCPQSHIQENGWSYFVQKQEGASQKGCVKAKQTKDIILLHDTYENKGNVTSSNCVDGVTIADIVFVLDTSFSICLDIHEGTCPNFNLLRNFTANMVDRLSVGKNAARIGLVSFSNKAKNEFYLNDYYDKESIKAKIQKVRYSQQSTNTSGAIKVMEIEQFIPSKGDRLGVQNIAIVITDGMSKLDADKTVPYAEDAQKSGITMIAVGVTNDINEDELRSISSPPRLLNHTYFTSPDFSTLEVLLERIIKEACEASALTPSRCIHQKYFQPPKILQKFPVTNTHTCGFGNEGTYQVALNTSQQVCGHTNSISTIYRNHVYFDTCHTDWPLQQVTLWCLSTINAVDVGMSSTGDVQLLYKQDKNLGKFYCTSYELVGQNYVLALDSREDSSLSCGIRNNKNRRKRSSVHSNDVLTLTTRYKDGSVNLDVAGLNPNKGPRSGGTNITIDGVLGPNKGSVILEDKNSVTFVDIQSWNGTLPTGQTGKTYTENGTRTVTVTQSDGNILRSNITYNYLPDPIITNVHPNTAIVAGGILITVEGSGFDYVTTAKLYIDMEKRSTAGSNGYRLDDTETFVSALGKRLSSSVYVFTTPTITLPDGYSSSKRKKRDTDDEIINNEQLQFFVGVQLDGVDAYRNLSDSELHQPPFIIYHNPEITPFDGVHNYDNTSQTFIAIQGEYLLNSLGKSVYTATLGASTCNVTEVVDNEIICKPPNIEPGVVKVGAYKEGLPRLQISVGSLTFIVGHVNYTTSSTTIYIIIGIVLGAVLVLIIIFGTIICQRRKRTPKTNLQNTENKKDIGSDTGNKDGAFESRMDKVMSNGQYEGLNKPSTSRLSRLGSNDGYTDTTLKRDMSIKYGVAYEYDNAYDNNKVEDRSPNMQQYEGNNEQGNINMENSTLTRQNMVKQEKQQNSVNNDMVQIRNRLMSTESYQDKTLSMARTYSYKNDEAYDNNWNNQTL